MEKLSGGKINHWTSRSPENFTFRIASDFLAQVETRAEDSGVTRSELADRMNVTLGRVSQMFNPGNMKLNSAVRLAQANGIKVALVAYDDRDPNNSNGPINGEIFHRCWKCMGSPTNFFAPVRSDC